MPQFEVSIVTTLWTILGYSSYIQLLHWTIVTKSSYFISSASLYVLGTCQMADLSKLPLANGLFIRTEQMCLLQDKRLRKLNEGKALVPWPFSLV